ncbi:MAG TPA: DUF1707 domain-containing protein [Pseudonocardiaceae bacterium]|nr:DUF1707 domain-containing protein [Pseudonocardiaceae bacterium]
MGGTKGTMGIVDDQTSRDRMRAADTDRQRVAEELRLAHNDGRLDLAEYDERVQQAWAARTYGELEALTTDLPRVAPPAAPAARHEVPQPHRHGRRGRAAVATWASASVINLLIWAIVSLATLSWIYPWWVWVAGPWGAVLVAGWIGERVRAPRPPR